MKRISLFDLIRNDFKNDRLDVRLDMNKFREVLGQKHRIPRSYANRLIPELKRAGYIDIKGRQKFIQFRK